MAENLIVIAYLTAKPGKEKEARKHIRALVAPTHAEKGCINYDLHEMHGDPAKFMFHETWVSPAHLVAHAKSAHMKAFRKILPEFLVGMPDITLWTKIK
jgi:quinol monooxygenase YgiN